MKFKNINKISIKSSNSTLVEGFNWAKKQALDYIHFDDPVGLWYEAALPGRNAFCMRDVSHQSTGAHLLGLSSFNKNMLKKFAENISETRDWCSYWEINKDNLPAPVDYKNDEDFWYNLPANFDILDCCYRQYLWTGDSDYINDEVFLNFYKRTVEDYVKCWDINNDGLLEYKGSCPYRGIPSYLEDQVGIIKIKSASDMLSAHYAGYLAYSKIQSLRGNLDAAKKHEEKANFIRNLFNSLWWNEEKKNYNTFILENGEFYCVSKADAEQPNSSLTPLPLYFDIAATKEKANEAINVLLNWKNLNVETESHYPEVLYKYGFNKEAFDFILDLTSPVKERREYPEVSYSVINSIVTGMLGVNPDSTKKVIATVPRLTPEIQWIEVDNIPVFGNEISIKAIENKEVTFANKIGETVCWKAAFLGDINELLVDEVKVKTQGEVRLDGNLYSYVELSVQAQEQHIVKVV